MKLKKLANSAKNFSVNRIIEIIGITIVISGILLLVSLISFYILLPLDNTLTVPLSVSFGIVSGSLFGFFGETSSIRKQLTKSYSNKHIVSLAKTSLLIIVLTCSALVLVNITL